MKDYLLKNADPWKIIENNFSPELNKISESVMSLGNGRMGQRANFEERYSGDSLQGSYVAGVYYPDKTRVGWWKNGYPKYFAKVLNSANWIGIDIEIEGEMLDLAKCKLEKFTRVLDMQKGVLERSFIAELPGGKRVSVSAKRFLSIVDDQAGVIRYEIAPLNFAGKISFTPYIDGDIKNEDANYDEKFWEEISREINTNEGYLINQTKKLNFQVCTGMHWKIFKNQQEININSEKIEKIKYIANKFSIEAKEQDKLILYKYGVNLSSENYQKSELLNQAKLLINKITNKGFEKMLSEQENAWKAKWQESDIIIEGDVAAQQGIRFNIFQLNQTYTGEDERLNIGPKGFTGEKYGGSTYWDTEAYCIPFYLSTADQSVAKNLLLYRYKQLGKAIENAEKLGFKNGAALYPMVTMNGEECHNEWEITFEEIHRNGAIAYAIYNYINHTGDKDYLINYGLEVLIAISRFWAQRVNFSEDKNQYVMLGVTGPNEYENNINNNWYTNYIACWVMKYTQEAIAYVKAADINKFDLLIKKLNFDSNAEIKKWQEIINNMHYPEDKKLGIFLQQEGYLDKEQILVKDLPKSEQPINQHWSWDRILRSCFIKQADVLQGLYFFENDFDVETLRRNFDFYEPRTVHESSLSPCVHVILASKLGREEKAYELYLRTARLDLDDYNNDTCDGCHITSMAGTWMAVVQGFGGMRVRDNILHFNPFIPKKWQGYQFKIIFRGQVIAIAVKHGNIILSNESDRAIQVMVWNKPYDILPKQQVSTRGNN